MLIQHGGADIRHVSPSVRFTGNKYLVVTDTEDVLEVLEPFDKVLCSLFLCGGFGGTRREASAYRLLHPKRFRLVSREIRWAWDTYQSMLVRFTHEYGLRAGCRVPDFQVQRPFSCNHPPRELQPGPPLSQIVMSSEGSPSLGWKTKNRASDWLL